MKEKIMGQAKVVIGRKWNNPEIYAVVTKEEIEMSLSLDDFLNALCEEIGSPLKLLTKAQLLKKLKSTSDIVVREVKTASASVV